MDMDGPDIVQSDLVLDLTNTERIQLCAVRLSRAYINKTQFERFKGAQNIKITAIFHFEA
jgi:hypothetical protein